MIRFVDVRGQGLQARFAWWDTVPDYFLGFCGSQAWSTWDEFKGDLRYNAPEPDEERLQRFRSLCPPWVFDVPTDSELDFPDEQAVKDAADAAVIAERRRLRLACAGCGETLSEDVRVSPEGQYTFIYVRPGHVCSVRQAETPAHA